MATQTKPQPRLYTLKLSDEERVRFTALADLLGLNVANMLRALVQKEARSYGDALLPHLAAAARRLTDEAAARTKEPTKEPTKAKEPAPSAEASAPEKKVTFTKAAAVAAAPTPNKKVRFSKGGKK